MRKVFTLFLFVLFISNLSLATEPSDTLWTKTFGGNNIDIGYSVQQTSDGGYIITGYTRSYGLSGHNIWLIKTDALGNQVWNNTFGGTGDDEAFSVNQTSDGGYILCGFTNSYGAGQKDFNLIKTNSSGNLEWQKMFGGTNDEEAYSVRQTPDKGFIVAGATSSFGTIGSRDVWLIKTDSLGNDQWKKSFGGMSSDGARCVQITLDGGYIITGWTYSNGASSTGSLWLLKVNSQGTEEWNKIFSGTSEDRGYFVEQTADSGYIVTGYSSSFGAGLYDMLLIKTDPSGNAQWKKYFGGTGRDYGNEVHSTAGGGYIIAGYTLSSGAGGDDVWIVKTDGSGILQWSKTYGGSASDVANSIKQTSDGGYIITGHTLSFGAGVHDVWLIKTVSSLPVELTSFNAENFQGNVRLSWATASESNNKGFEVERQKINATSDDWQIIGFVEGKGTTTIKQQYIFTDKNNLPGAYNYRLKQRDFGGAYEYSGVVEVVVGLPEKYLVKQNYPNPFNPSTTIEYSLPQTSYVSIKVFDMLGEELEVLTKEIKPAGTYRINWNADKYSGGVYFYEVRAGNYSKTYKMILMK